MATHNSTYYKPATVARTSADVKLNPAKGLTLRVEYAKITGGEQTLAQNDLVNLFDLPNGAIPHAYKLKAAVGTGFGASVTLDVGWSGAENALISALDIHAAGSGVNVGWTLLGAGPSDPLTAYRQVQAKFEGANPADNQDLEIWLAYFGNK